MKHETYRDELRNPLKQNTNDEKILRRLEGERGFNREWGDSTVSFFSRLFYGLSCLHHENLQTLFKIAKSFQEVSEPDQLRPVSQIFVYSLMLFMVTTYLFSGKSAHLKKYCAVNKSLRCGSACVWNVDVQTCRLLDFYQSP